MSHNEEGQGVKIISSREIVLPEIKERLGRWGINLGVPIKSGTEHVMEIPENPHVFFCREVWLYEGDNPVDKLENVMVMHGHGVTAINEKGERQWVFRGTGKPVFSTVRAYEDLARQYNLPQVDIITACREASEDQGTGVRVLFTQRVDLPYIHANSTVINYTNPILQNFAPNIGMSSASFGARRWFGINDWRRKRELDQANREIPVWAKMPAK